MDEKIISSLLSLHGFELVMEIGRGAFGSVFMARSTKYGEIFCIKITKYSESAEKEVINLKNLSHPNIITAYDYFIEEELLFIVLEYCPNGTLADMCRLNGKIEPPILYVYMKQLLEALDFCHSLKIVHRDIKPSNVLIDKYGRLKLTDFGLSKMTVLNETDSSLVGSRYFMAPEVIKRNCTDLFAADVWSLGITFYFMATGNYPWPDCSQNELLNYMRSGAIIYPNNLPAEFIHVIRAMIVHNPAKRAKLSDIIKSSLFPKKISPSMSHFKGIQMNIPSSISQKSVKDQINETRLASLPINYKLPTFHCGMAPIPMQNYRRKRNFSISSFPVVIDKYTF